MNSHFVEDRKSKGEKYDADIEKYIADTLKSMRYCILISS